jgi:DNA-binding PadR family transcriptional regulator
MSGYEIMICFVKKFGIIVSPSVVYSALYSLEREGLVLGIIARRGRIYGLTQEGRRSIEKTRSSIAEMENFIRLIIGG